MPQRRIKIIDPGVAGSGKRKVFTDTGVDISHLVMKTEIYIEAGKDTYAVLTVKAECEVEAALDMVLEPKQK